MTYKIESERLEDAVLSLVEQFREQNPSLSRVKLDMSDGVVVTISIPAKPKKSKPLQCGASVTTTGGYLNE